MAALLGVVCVKWLGFLEACGGEEGFMSALSRCGLELSGGLYSAVGSLFWGAKAGID